LAQAFLVPPVGVVIRGMASYVALAAVHLAVVTNANSPMTFNYAAFIPNTEEYCYHALVANPACCLDKQFFEGVRQKGFYIPGTEWHCSDYTKCFDVRKGIRGKGSMWIPEAADCTTPRILFIHGGAWYYDSPFDTGYPQLASRIANLAGAIVYMPDYPLVPIGNFSTILDASIEALRWLAKNGPDGTCPLPVPPLFISGDSSGGGTAMSVVLKLVKEPHLNPYDGDGRVTLHGAFFFSPWTNLKCNTPDYYYHAFAKVVPKSPDTSRTAYIGDVVFRGDPLANKAKFTANARQYVGNKDELLTDGIASPVFADLQRHEWQRVPPLYFAVGGSESILGDSVLVAQKAAHHGVEVQLDVYPGMWHDFPMYTEGCGSGIPLWQGMHALRRVARFVRSISKTGMPSCTTFPGRGGATPFTVFHYNNPTKDDDWFADDQACAMSDSAGQGAVNPVHPPNEKFWTGFTTGSFVGAALASGALVGLHLYLNSRSSGRKPLGFPFLKSRIYATCQDTRI